jgi:hypothetical protein
VVALSTQCGLALVIIGANLITEVTQRHKLELFVEVAHKVW